MKYTKIREGYYRSESGYYIKSNAGKNIWTARPMKPTYWYIYDREVTKEARGQWIGGGCTLREAKAEVEKMSESRR